jgi:hypothetical protein
MTTYDSAECVSPECVIAYTDEINDFACATHGPAQLTPLHRPPTTPKRRLRRWAR